MFESEKEVNISDWGFDKPAVVRRFNGRERQIMRTALRDANNITVKVVGKKTVSEGRPTFEEDILWAFHGLQSAPFPHKSKDELANQDWELIEKISREVQAVNDYFSIAPPKMDEEEEERRIRCPGCGRVIDLSDPGLDVPSPTLNAHVTMSR